jgi:D-arabinose 1-dehydrogenase-like Zn-dependent alcohol dehydrogenase
MSHNDLSVRVKNEQQPTMATEPIPKTQTVAIVRSLGGPVEFQDDYPVPTPGHNEVLAKVLYTGVCQSGEYTCHKTDWKEDE